ncbi:MAG: hypothetical protein BROFUL_02644 [Candidatus Brocadia fulgida]|uniref:Lipid/polyisoprenoid-binding YceI-like domain-containing protein n=1 Tax=Candidatus Brocadia fulgida TaxID=380242 RepID=A0A0M2US74_9BACT|nr:MAG: hypothetical protein BROFUL_02644 [Candidatus Brocadia fulgida]MBV6519335.1 Protein YceI [Candidatus Brocadia fulgida]
MGVKEGSYHVTASSGKVCVYTFKEGFLSAVAHDLLIEATNFCADLHVPAGGMSLARVTAEIQANSLKVICAMKDGLQRHDLLKEKDKADIEEATSKDVLHPDKYPAITFRSINVKEKDGAYHVEGELTLHGVTRPAEIHARTTTGNDLKGKLVLSQKDFGIKPYKALLGTLKVKNEVEITFDLQLK